MVSVSVITETSDLNALKDEWCELFPHVHTASVPLSYAWNSIWWSHYGSIRGNAPGGLRIFVFREKEKLVGLLPLFLEYPSRTLRFLSSGGPPGDSVFPEFLDILALPEKAEACLKAFSEHVSRMNEWDSVSLAFSRKNCALEAFFQRYTLSLWKKEQVLSSPYATLDAGFDAYLAGCGTSQRHFRRVLRQCERLNVSLTIASSEDDCAAMLETLFAQHQQTWNEQGAPGAFQSNTLRAFHRDLALALLRQGELFLAELKTPESSLGVIYGFCRHKRFELYQTGRARESQVKSPGIALHLFALRALAEQGVTVYDFLGGNAEYKRRFATGSSRLTERTFVRITGRTLFTEAMRIYARLRTIW